MQADAQVVAMRKDARRGVQPVDLLQEHRAIGKATFFTWRNYGGAGLFDVKPLREL